MSDRKETTEMGNFTLQLLLKLSSDQYNVIVIIHFISIILNSFQTFFFYAGGCILPSCAVSAPTPLSLRVCPEQKAQLVGADSVELLEYIQPSIRESSSHTEIPTWCTTSCGYHLRGSGRTLPDTVQCHMRAEHSGSPICSLDGGWQRIKSVSTLFQVFAALE